MSSPMSSQISAPVKKYLRANAVGLWDRLSTVTREMGDQIHHRIPLEWSHIFPDRFPNRLANLNKVASDVHAKITTAWREFKTRLAGRDPTQTEVLDQARVVDQEFGAEMTKLKDTTKQS